MIIKGKNVKGYMCFCFIFKKPFITGWYRNQGSVVLIEKVIISLAHSSHSQ